MNKYSLLSLVNIVFLLFLLASASLEWFAFKAIFSYPTHELMHVFGAIIFIGNVVVGPIWVTFAYFSKDLTHMNFALKVLLITDVIVTIPSIDLTVLNGLALASVYGGINALYWLKHALWDLVVLFSFVVPLIFIQDRLSVLVKNQKVDSAVFKKYIIWWMVVGGLSFIPLFHLFYLMIIRPL